MARRSHPTHFSFLLLHSPGYQLGCKETRTGYLCADCMAPLAEVRPPLLTLLFPTYPCLFALVVERRVFPVRPGGAVGDRGAAGLLGLRHRAARPVQGQRRENQRSAPASLLTSCCWIDSWRSQCVLCCCVVVVGGSQWFCSTSKPACCSSAPLSPPSAGKTLSINNNTLSPHLPQPLCFFPRLSSLSRRFGILDFRPTTASGGHCVLPISPYTKLLLQAVSPVFFLCLLAATYPLELLARRLVLVFEKAAACQGEL